MRGSIPDPSSATIKAVIANAFKQRAVQSLRFRYQIYAVLVLHWQGSSLFLVLSRQQPEVPIDPRRREGLLTIELQSELLVYGHLFKGKLMTRLQRVLKS